MPGIDRHCFGQVHCDSQGYFLDRCGRTHSIGVKRFPHYLHIEQYLAGNLMFESSEYVQYLRHSWLKRYNSPIALEEAIFARVQRFERQAEMIHAMPDKHVSVSCILHPDGDQHVVIDGNHRISIARALGRPIYCDIIPTKHQLAQWTTLSGMRYGAPDAIPYQPVVWHGDILIPGRRNDTYERQQLMVAEDFRGASLLDLGCNIGGSCYVAHEAGANRIEGWDYDPGVITAAIRLNTLYRSDARFYVRDLAQPIQSSEQYGVILCFSLLAHLRNPKHLIRFLSKQERAVLYVELHPGHAWEDYLPIVRRAGFGRVERMGALSASAVNPKKNRALYRCVHAE